jgi:hypothetical protein
MELGARLSPLRGRNMTTHCHDLEVALRVEYYAEGLRESGHNDEEREMLRKESIRIK